MQRLRELPRELCVFYDVVAAYANILAKLVYTHIVYSTAFALVEHPMNTSPYFCALCVLYIYSICSVVSADYMYGGNVLAARSSGWPTIKHKVNAARCAFMWGGAR